MNRRLERTWTASLGRMRKWRADHDPTPVYETLGWAVVLSLTGDLATRPTREIEELEETGRRALSKTGRRDEDHKYASSLAHAGVSALRGSLDGVPALGDLMRPSPNRVLRMLSGELDGLAAAGCALHLSRTGSADTAASMAPAEE